MAAAFGGELQIGRKKRVNNCPVAARERSRFVALHSWRPRASRLSHPMLFNNIHSQNVIDPGLCGKDQQSETFHFLSSKLTAAISKQRSVSALGTLKRAGNYNRSFKPCVSLPRTVTNWRLRQKNHTCVWHIRVTQTVYFVDFWLKLSSHCQFRKRL